MEKLFNCINFLAKICKVNSVQEACAKCLSILTSKFEILQITEKHENKEH